MAIFTEPKKWGVIPGSAADVGEIQEKGSTLYPSIADLWPAIYQLALSKGGKAPERTGFNAFFKMIMERLYFIERGGVWSYDATADYPAGAVVGYSGSLYLALKDNGPGTGTGAVTPGKNTSVWQKLVLESGNAASATKLAAKRTIALSGAATGTATGFDGTANIAIPVTSLDASKLTGTASVSTTGNAASATKLAAKRTIALSGAATGTATGFDGSGNIAIPVTALAASAIRAQWYAAFPDGAEAHNAMWGGRDITAAFNNGTVSANIANGTFKDIFPGDYITKAVTISGTTYTVNWVIADCDYWWHKGDNTAMETHHVVIVPQAPIFTANMNATNTTEGGYAGSRMYTETIPACATGIVNAFGASHILTFRDHLTRDLNTSAVSSGITVFTGAPNWNGAWYSQQCNLMSEAMVYDGPHCASSALDNIMATRQMSIFRLSERAINPNRAWWWLRDVVSSAYFAFVSGYGSANAHYASNVFGVRPFALLV